MWSYGKIECHRSHRLTAVTCQSHWQISDFEICHHVRPLSMRPAWDVGRPTWGILMIRMELRIHATRTKVFISKTSSCHVWLLSQVSTIRFWLTFLFKNISIKLSNCWWNPHLPIFYHKKKRAFQRQLPQIAFYNNPWFLSKLIMYL